MQVIRACASLVGLTLLILVTGVVVAVPDVPAPVGNADHVGSSVWQTGTVRCWSAAPDAGGLLDEGITSYISHTAAGGVTSWSLHLQTVAGHPECPALDIAWTSSIAAWPAKGTEEVAPVASSCGITGSQETSTGTYFMSAQLKFSVPVACGAAVAGVVQIDLFIEPLHTTPYLVCAPVFVAGLECEGIVEGSGSCANGESSGHTQVLPFVEGSHECWNGDETDVSAPDFDLRATENGCVIHIATFTLPCPDALGEAVQTVPWGHVLP